MLIAIHKYNNKNFIKNKQLLNNAYDEVIPG